mgnify:CR=1 FL=1
MDNLTKEQRQKNMRNIRSAGTKPELKVMQALKKRKVHFAEHVANVTGKPDIVFRRKKVAVFIDSDFWHGHPERCIMPKTNTEYWSRKIQRNRARDEFVNDELKKKGWTVIRLWEYDIKHNFDQSLEVILRAIGKTQSEPDSDG